MSLLLFLFFVLRFKKKLIQHWFSVEIRLWGRSRCVFHVALVVALVVAAVATVAAAADVAAIALFVAAFIVLTAGGVIVWKI